MKQERKKNKKVGVRTQRTATILIDDEFINVWKSLPNKSRFVNDALREYFFDKICTGQ